MVDKASTPSSTKELLEKTGLSQVEIAAYCGCTRALVSMLLSGRTTSTRLSGIIDKLAGVEAGTCARLSKEQGRVRMEAIRARVLKEKAITRKDS